MLTYKIFLTVLAVLFLVVPAYLLYSNAVDASGAKDLPEKSMQLAAPINEYYGTPTEVSPPATHKHPSDICVTFEMLSIDPSSSFANLGILVGVTDHGRGMLKGLAKTYKNITVWATSYSGLSTVHVTVPMSVLLHAPASTCGSGQVSSECPLGQADDKTICSAELDQHAAFRETGSDYILGQARAFPQDWYQLDDLVAVRDGVDIDGKPLYSSLLMMTRDDNFTTKGAPRRKKTEGLAISAHADVHDAPPAADSRLHLLDLGPALLAYRGDPGPPMDRQERHA
jgi:hypothetical protein